ncbi:maleate cis-trans isomerase family protein [Amycolatopsis sacchari]|uniref:Maleate isomerase n=1 Tax=Amycolatopsis sacchari TaxID=115433 RepID=A0A1I3KI56_9PSEU|nr:Asp/Glu racemase [Amycolatopsis sacchari]SFI71895.1 maleate isomerase [Amycolatopsis sacchari]
MRVETPGPEPQVGLGVVAPYDFSRDRELWRWVPDTVSVFIARTERVTGADNLGTVSALGDPSVVARPTREVCEIGARVVAYACTSCSFAGGARAEGELRRAMLAAGAPHALTTSGAAVRALRAVGARRIAVVHPYEEPVGERLARYLAEAGFEVADTTALGVPVDEALTASYTQVADLVLTGNRADADAVFVSCTALPTYDLIAPLERELGKPVVTANQATMWAALEVLGLPATGPGQRLCRVHA